VRAIPFNEVTVLNKNPLVLIVLGAILLAVAGWMTLSIGPTAADPTLRQACEASMAERGGDAELKAQCSQVAFATAATATDAQSAAREISAANNSEIGGGAVSMFLLGLGLALLIGGVTLRLRKSPAGSNQS